MGLVLAGEIVLLGRKWYNSGSGLACLSQTSKSSWAAGALTLPHFRDEETETQHEGACGRLSRDRADQ